MANLHDRLEETRIQWEIICGPTDMTATEDQHGMRRAFGDKSLLTFKSTWVAAITLSQSFLIVCDPPSKMGCILG